MASRRKYRLKVFAVSVLLGLSVASFAYLNTLDETLAPAPTIFVEEVDEENGELLPDVQLIKMLMNKTLEFVTYSLPLGS